MSRRVPPRGKIEPKIKLVHTEKDTFSSCISFSFRFLDMAHHKFNVNNKQANYFKKLIDRLKDISGIEKRQLSGYSNKTLRFHSITWEDTTERCFGIPNEDTTAEEPMQFSLSANEHGRVHGFFIENVFYIVWLDPNHELYTSK